MFSGIIEEAAEVSAMSVENGAARITIKSRLDHAETNLGDSIAINGVCLTVVEKRDGMLSFDAVAETLRRSTLGTLKPGARVKLERSLQVNARLHGHFVFGHVDATARLLARSTDGNSDRLTFELPKDYRGYVVPKGSVSLSGISLTVGEVTEDAFSVYIEPHTAEVTTLGDLKIGERVNFEVDMLARYVFSAVRNT